MRNAVAPDAHRRGGQTTTAHVLQRRKEKAVDHATALDVMTMTSASGTVGMKMTKMNTVGHVMIRKGVLPPTPCAKHQLSSSS
jgi:hypothetical protein